MLRRGRRGYSKRIFKTRRGSSRKSRGGKVAGPHKSQAYRRTSNSALESKDTKSSSYQNKVSTRRRSTRETMRAGAISQPRNQFREIVVGQLNMNSLNYGLLEKVFNATENSKVNFFKDYPHQGIIKDTNNSPMFPHANEIIPRLWLGNRYAAANEDDFLLRHNITTVFNASKDIPFHDSVKMRYRIAVDDNLRPEEIANMTKWAPEIIFHVLKEYNAGKPILVHCAAGMQRSAAIVAMFLIAYKGMTADEAMNYIRNIRPIAFTPAANFEDSIRNFEIYYKNDLIPQISKHTE